MDNGYWAASASGNVRPAAASIPNAIGRNKRESFTIGDLQ
jgi:hypothetical protein